MVGCWTSDTCKHMYNIRPVWPAAYLQNVQLQIDPQSAHGDSSSWISSRYHCRWRGCVHTWHMMSSHDVSKLALSQSVHDIQKKQRQSNTVSDSSNAHSGMPQDTQDLPVTDCVQFNSTQVRQSLERMRHAMLLAHNVDFTGTDAW